MAQLSRRSFLKTSLTAAGAACVSQVPLPAAAKPKNDQELATLIDIRKCVGCEECVEACREVNGPKYPDPQKPYPQMYPRRVKVADWSDEGKRVSGYISICCRIMPATESCTNVTAAMTA